MEKEGHKIKDQIAAIIIIASVVILIIGSIVVKLFFWDETYGRIHDLTEDYPLLLYPILALTGGFVSFLIYRDLNNGKDNDRLSIFKFIIIAGGTIFFTVNFSLKLFEKF